MGKGQTKDFHYSMNDNYVEGTLTCLKSEVIKNRINTNFPLVLNIEPTNACNLKCVYCPRLKTVSRYGTNFIELETYKKIIDEACEYGPLIMLNLHKDGEPLLNKNLSEMVGYAKKRQVAQTIHLNTNGTLLNTKFGYSLLDSGIDDMTISVDASFSDTYKKLKQSSQFDELIKGIESFIEYKNKLNVSTLIRVKIMEFEDISANEISEFVNKWNGIADEVQVTGIHDWSGEIKDIKITDETSDVRFPCALLWYALAVNSNGMVSICNVDWDYSGVIGNLKDKKLHEIWNDTKIRKVRLSHLQTNWNYVPVCDKCVVWTSVGNLKDFFKYKKEFIE